MKQEQASRQVKHLFESWGRSLFCYARRGSGSSALADDLVQEAFLALYQSLRDGKTIGNPKAWTLSVVRNQLRRYWRDTKRHGEDMEASDVLENLPSQPDPMEFEKEDRVSEFLSLLSRREEEVLLLRLQSLKYREIAQQMGISAKSVATLLARALRKIRVVEAGVGSHAHKTLQ
jgi:RNA polymerase sigma-70 factor, ECF subfamily